MRVFTAMPVIVRDQVAGVVYASRTPSNVFKYLFELRGKVIPAARGDTHYHACLRALAEFNPTVQTKPA